MNGIVMLATFLGIVLYLTLSGSTTYDCTFQRVEDGDGNSKVFIVTHMMLYHGRDSQMMVSDDTGRLFALPRKQLAICKKREKENG